MAFDIVQNISELERGVFSPFRGRYVPKNILDKFSRSQNPSDFGNSDLDFLEYSIYDDDRVLLEHSTDKSFQKIEEGSIFFDIGRHVENSNLSDGTNYIIQYKFLRKIIGSEIGQKIFIEEISSSGTEIRVSPVIVGNQNVDLESKNQFRNFFGDSFESYTPGGETSAFKFIINFGNNIYHHILNWSFDDEDQSVILKLYNPVGDQITVGDEFWVNEELANPYFDRFSFEILDTERNGQVLRGPNFSINEFNNKKSDTGFQTWNSLVEGNKSFSSTQSLINEFINSDQDKVDLNINYNEFENFVHFSSAEERIKNFRYKLRVIHDYQKEIEEIQKDSDSFKNLKEKSFSNKFIEENKEKIANTIDSFDGYEKWLFEADSDKFENTYPKDGGKLVDVNSTEAQEWFDRILKKALRYDEKNNDRLVNNLPVFIKEDSENESFILFIEMIGHFFDLMWVYIEHMKYITDRTEDINKLESLSKDLSRFVSKSFGYELYNGFDDQDLVDYGFRDGKEEEIQYVFSPLHGTGSDLDNYGETNKKVFPVEEKEGVEKFLETGQDVQRQIWRRVLNTIPHLSKTKGSERAISAILSSYGIPRSALSVKEYGGTKLDHKSTLYEFTDETHSIGMINGERVDIPWGQNANLVLSNFSWQGAMRIHRNRPNSVEIRFKTEYIPNDPLTLFEIGDSIIVTLEPHPNFDKPFGRIRIKLVDDNGIPVDTFFLANGNTKDDPDGPVCIFDGDWNNFILNINPNRFEIEAKFQKRSRFGNIKQVRYKAVGSDTGNNPGNSTFPLFNSQNQNVDFPIFTVDENVVLLGKAIVTSEKLYIGGEDANFVGDIDNIKLWKDPITEDKFDDHTRGPAKYDWNNDLLIKEENKHDLYSKDVTINRKLLFNADFTNAKNLFDDDLIKNESPNGEFIDNDFRKAIAVNFSDETEYPYQFDRYTRTNFIFSVKVGANALYNDKIRLEENSLLGNLSSERRSEIGSLDEIIKDSSKLGIFFSPQKEINEDILLSIGVENINDLLGDPRDNRNERYEDLDAFNRKYWIKYPRPYDIQEYFEYVSQFNKAFFDQVRDLVPARADLRDGLLVQPHLLERDKIKETEVELEKKDKNDTIDLDIENLVENSSKDDDRRAEINITGNIGTEGRDSDYAGDEAESYEVFPELRYAGNFDPDTDFQTKIKYTLEEQFEDFDRQDFEDAIDKEAYLESRTFNCDLRRVYRRIPFKEFVGTFIKPINNPDFYFHNNYSFFYGNAFVYGDPAAQATSPYNGQPQFAAVYDICSFYSGGSDPIDQELFIPDNFGGSVRKPQFPYKRNRHYIFHREFSTADKKMKYLGVVNDSSTSLTKEGAVNITFTSPDRIIVDPTDRDKSGQILEVE